MADATIVYCYLVTVDHPRSLLQVHGPNIVLKFHFNRFTTFRDMAIWKFENLALNPIPAPKIYVFWVWSLNEAGSWLILLSI